MTNSHCLSFCVSHISTHILTKRMTCQNGYFIIPGVISTHILTKRMTFPPRLSYQLDNHFNSHPHEEDDFAEAGKRYRYLISTHILTKRMTKFFIKEGRGNGISTHILTKRMTKESVNNIANVIFQLTSSRRGWLTFIYLFLRLLYFNSHPHEEDDFYFVHTFFNINISTHILTKRMTVL